MLFAFYLGGFLNFSVTFVYLKGLRKWVSQKEEEEAKGGSEATRRSSAP